MDGLGIGRIVHFMLADTVCRAAIIVNDWDGKLEDGMVNLQVFVDGGNDTHKIEELQKQQGLAIVELKNSIGESSTFATHAQLWITSVKYSETKEVGTWHFPERK